MQPYPRAASHLWPGDLHATGCLSARAMDTGFSAVIRRARLGWGCAVVPPFLAGIGVVCDQVWFFSPSAPFLAGAWGLRLWGRALPFSRLSRFGVALRGFGCGLLGSWSVCVGTGSG